MTDIVSITALTKGTLVKIVDLYMIDAYFDLYESIRKKVFIIDKALLQDTQAGREGFYYIEAKDSATKRTYIFAYAKPRLLQAGELVPCLVNQGEV